MTVSVSITAHFDDEASELAFVQSIAGVVRRGGVLTATASAPDETLGFVDLLNDPRATPGSLEARAAAAELEPEPTPEPEADSELPNPDTAPVEPAADDRAER